MPHSESPENKSTFNTFQEVAGVFGFSIRQINEAGGTKYVFTVPGTNQTFATQPNQTPDQFFNQLTNDSSIRQLIQSGKLNEPNITTEGPGTAPTIKAAPQQDFNPDTRLATSLDEAVKLSSGSSSSSLERPLSFEDLAQQFGGKLGTSTTASGPGQTFSTSADRVAGGEGLFSTFIQQGETPEQFQQRLTTQSNLKSRFPQANQQSPQTSSDPNITDFDLPTDGFKRDPRIPTSSNPVEIEGGFVAPQPKQALPGGTNPPPITTTGFGTPTPGTTTGFGDPTPQTYL